MLSVCQQERRGSCVCMQRVKGFHTRTLEFSERNSKSAMKTLNIVFFNIQVFIVERNEQH